MAELTTMDTAPHGEMVAPKVFLQLPPLTGATPAEWQEYALELRDSAHLVHSKFVQWISKAEEHPTIIVTPDGEAGDAGRVL